MCLGITISIASSPTVGQTQFSVNGLFDPYITGGGHQPMYFDQLAAIYKNYTVLKSKITADFFTSTAQNLVVGVYIDDNTSLAPITSLSAMTENTSSVWKPLGNTAAIPFTRVVKFWDAKQAFGGNIRDNDDLGAAATANPALQQYFSVFAGSVGGAGSITVTGFVTVEYTSVWDNLLPQDENV